MAHVGARGHLQAPPLLREMGNAQVSRPIDATAPFSGICCTCFTIPRCKLPGSRAACKFTQR